MPCLRSFAQHFVGFTVANDQKEIRGLCHWSRLASALHGTPEPPRPIAMAPVKKPVELSWIVPLIQLQSRMEAAIRRQLMVGKQTIPSTSAQLLSAMVWVRLRRHQLVMRSCITLHQITPQYVLQTDLQKTINRKMYKYFHIAILEDIYEFDTTIEWCENNYSSELCLATHKTNVDYSLTASALGNEKKKRNIKPAFISWFWNGRLCLDQWGHKRWKMMSKQHNSLKHDLFGYKIFSKLLVQMFMVYKVERLHMFHFKWLFYIFTPQNDTV